jgi:hypothetical protein
VIHPREHDLVIATHGRGLYVVDDITPLRTLGPDVLEREAAILDARPQVAFTAAEGAATANGDAEFVGRSLGESAFITYYLKRRHMFGDLKIEVYAPDGTLLSTIPGGKRRGINRVAWPMRAKGPRLPAGAGIIPSMGAFVGPKALPGVYRVKLIKGRDTFEGEVRLVPDPRSEHGDADRAAQRALVGELFTLAERMTYTVESMAEARDQARARAAALPPGDRLRPRLEALAGTFDAQRKALVASKEGEGISGEEKLREELGVLYGNVNGYEGRPTESQRRRMAVLAKQLDAADAAFDATLAREGAALNRDLARRKLAPIARPTRAEWDARGAR